jgi:hypothetical protein
VLFFASPRAAISQAQGYGVSATGGAGGQVCTVTRTAATGAGSFSDCARRGNVVVQFNGPGPYIVDGETTYLKSNTTIDGCANGQNGVTLDQPTDIHRAVVVEGPASNFVFRCLRFQGHGKVNAASTEFDLLGFDGTGGAISRVLVDRCTFSGATDGATDIVGNVTDVTIQRSLYYANPLTMLNKYGARARISIHHNVLTGNCERNPQIKGALNGFDFVSNVVGPEANPSLVDGESGNAWRDCYGIRIWAGNSASDSPGNPKGNVISNAFFGQDPVHLQADAGASLAGVYLRDNSCQGTGPYVGPCPSSPAAAALSVPTANVVTETPTSLIRTAMLPTVGSPNRTAADQARIDAVAAALPCTPVSPPQISIGDQSVSEGNSDTRLMVFPATLSAGSPCPVSTSYATADGTASAGSDYDAATGLLLFPVGSTSQNVSVRIRGDRVFEGDEYLLVNLVGPNGGTIADGQAVGTIVNEDAPGFSVNDVAVVEPASGTTTANFTVTLSPTSGGPTSVNYATANGTAAAPADYAAASGTLSFAAGVSTQPVSIVVNADSLKEGVETFTINLSNPTGGVAIGAAQGTGRIYDKGAFFTLSPCRVVDTRGTTVGSGLGGPALAANSTRPFTLTLAGSCGVPANAKAVALNVTVTGATRAGDLRLYAAGAPLPLASTINYVAGQTRANNVVVNVNASGQLAVRCDQSSGTVHLIVDVAGYVL